MTCNISTDKNGNIAVRADNGQPSILFKHLKATLGNEKEALNKWAITKTPEFASYFNSLENPYTDENGEPAMIYVETKNDFLYYAKKDEAASARAKDIAALEEDLEKKADTLNEQTSILRAKILQEFNIYKTAEETVARNNQFSDIANKGQNTLRKHDNAITALTEFSNFSLLYLSQASERMAKLKDTTDTDARLQALNELGQFLVIFDNLDRFNDLVGDHDDTLFQLTMKNFFEEFGIVPDKDTAIKIKYYKDSTQDLMEIREFIDKRLSKTKLTDKEKTHVLSTYDKLLRDKPNLTSTLDDVVRRKNRLKNKLKNDYYNTIGDWLFPYINENQENLSSDLKITKKDFINQLKQAKQDVGLGTYALASMSNVKDPLAQAIRLDAEQRLQEAHYKTQKVYAGLTEAAKKQYKNGRVDDFSIYLKDLEKSIMVIDENGDRVMKTIKTKGLVTEYQTERLEKERNVEREKQREYFEKAEDQHIASLEQRLENPKIHPNRAKEIRNTLEEAKKNRDWTIRKNTAKAMNAWYETKYDVMTHKTDLINQKKKELSEEDFKLWYSNNIYLRSIPADELAHHKKTRGKFRMVHPEHLNDAEIKESSFYQEGHRVNGKVVEYYVHEVYFGGEFTTPIQEYRDNRYDNLTKDSLFRELTAQYNKHNSLLPPRHKLKHGMIPQIEGGSKSFINSDKTIGENIKEMWKNMSPDWAAEENYYETEVDGELVKVMRVNKNVDGTIVKTVPIKFLSLIEDQEMLDTNLLETFTKFAAVVNRHTEMGRAEASARALKNIVAGNPSLGILAREVALTDSDGNVAKTIIKNATEKVLSTAIKEKHKLNDMIIDFVDDVWYGDVEEKANFTLLDKKLSINKIANSTSKWVSIQRLAGNLDSALSNLVIGKLSIFNEAIAGRYYSIGDFYHATKIINEDLYKGVIIDDYMQENLYDKSLWAQLMIHHDAIQGEFTNEYGIKIGKKTAAEMGKDFLFFSQNGMEYTIQKRALICTMLGFKVQLPDDMVYNKSTGKLEQATAEQKLAAEKVRGEIQEKYKALLDRQQAAIKAEEAKNPTEEKEMKKVAKNLSKMRRDLENISVRMDDELSKTATNYFTAFDAYKKDDVTGALQIKEELRPYFGKKEETKLRHRNQELNKRQQGNYAPMDKAQAQRHWVGKLVLMFRKYLFSAYEHRFGDRQVNYALGEETYGYQRAFFNKINQDYKAYGAWAFQKLFDGSASPAEQYAINKTAIEYATWAAFAALFWLMRSLQDDDEESNFFYSKTMYIVKRTEDSLSEFTLPFGIGTLVRTMKNPFSPVVLIEQVYEVFAVVADDPLNWGGVYARDSGLNKAGDSKFWGKLLKVSPILRQIPKWLTPEEQLKYYTQRRTNV